MNAAVLPLIDWKARCLAAEDALRRARSKLMMTRQRKRVLAILSGLPVGRSMTTGDVARALGLREDTANAALKKLADSGFVDRSKHRGHNGAPVRWRLAHAVVVPEGEQEKAAA